MSFYINNFEIGPDTINPNDTSCRLNGLISQPLVRNIAYYPYGNNFTPVQDLTPLSSDPNVVFFVNSNLTDSISGNKAITYGTVINTIRYGY